jgi:hypothetical protein
MPSDDEDLAELLAEAREQLRDAHTNGTAYAQALISYVIAKKLVEAD